MIPIQDAVRRHGQRAGYRLLTYAEVALPLWRLNLRCRMLEQKTIPPIEEFTLKAMAAGLTTPTELEGFLGLDEFVVRGVLAGLAGDDLIAFGQREGGLELRLTPKGTRALGELSLTLPEERQYPVYLDGLTREFVTPAVPLERPRDVDERGLMEIPAVPAGPPELGDLVKDELDRFLKAQSPREDKRDLLSIEAIEGRRERAFVPGIALVFAADGASDVQVAFLIDGRPSPRHEEAFAAAEGARKIGIVRRLRESVPFEAAQALLPADLVRGATDSTEARQLRDAAVTFTRIAEEERERLLTSEAELERETARDRLESVESRLSEINTELASLPARQIEVFEHPQLLRQALEEATTRILIVSPWIRAGVVDDKFVDLLTDALLRGVSVSIGYGLGDDDYVPPRDAAARDRLHELAAHHPNLTIGELGDTHAKVLVLDSRFVVVTSFNWLSFRGDPNKPFRDERGMLVTVPDLIEQLYSDFDVRISGAAR